MMRLRFNVQRLGDFHKWDFRLVLTTQLRPATVTRANCPYCHMNRESSSPQTRRLFLQQREEHSHVHNGAVAWASSLREGNGTVHVR